MFFLGEACPSSPKQAYATLCASRLVASAQQYDVGVCANTHTGAPTRRRAEEIALEKQCLDSRARVWFPNHAHCGKPGSLRRTLSSKLHAGADEEIFVAADITCRMYV